MSKQKVLICPICRKEAKDQNFLPFCSERCKRIDLGAWASESYKVKGPASEDEKEDEDPIETEH